MMIGRQVRGAHWWTLVVGGVLVMAACGGDEGSTGPDGLVIADLAGTWDASEFVYSQAGTGPVIPNAFRLTDNVGQAEFDLDGDGVEEPVRLMIRFARR